MVDIPLEQIIVACALGLVAGVLFYAIGRWLLRRSRQRLMDDAKISDMPLPPLRAPVSATPPGASEELIARFAEELSRASRGSASKRL